MKNPAIFGTNSVILRTNPIISGTNPSTFRTNPMILRTIAEIFRSNPVVFRTNPALSMTLLILSSWESFPYKPIGSPYLLQGDGNEVKSTTACCFVVSKSNCLKLMSFYPRINWGEKIKNFGKIQLYKFLEFFKLNSSF